MAVLRASVIRIAVFLWLMGAAAAQAECERLSVIMALATDTLLSTAPADVAALQRMGPTIGAIRNDDLMALMRRAGQSTDFGDLRNVLTHLKLIAQLADQQDIIVSDTLRSDLRDAIQTVNAICTYVQANPTPTSEGSERLPGINSAALSQPKQIRPLTTQQMDLVNRTGQLRHLGLFAAVVAVVILLGVLARFGLVYLNVIRRGRRLCDVPAQLCNFIHQIDGNISIIGQKGCRFIPQPTVDKETAALFSAGTYCTLVVGQDRFDARLFRDTRQDCRMLFAKPLNASTLKQLVKLSRTPCRYDFTFTKRDRRRG